MKIDLTERNGDQTTRQEEHDADARRGGGGHLHGRFRRQHSVHHPAHRRRGPRRRHRHQFLGDHHLSPRPLRAHHPLRQDCRPDGRPQGPLRRPGNLRLRFPPVRTVVGLPHAHRMPFRTGRGCGDDGRFRAHVLHRTPPDAPAWFRDVHCHHRRIRGVRTRPRGRRSDI